MVQHPDVLKKAQAEVDLVVGTHRLPDLSDKISLPYIEAIIQECLRWQPVLPVGGYHLTLTIVICRITYHSSQLFPTSSLRMTSIGASLSQRAHWYSQMHGQRKSLTGIHVPISNEIAVASFMMNKLILTRMTLILKDSLKMAQSTRMSVTLVWHALGLAGGSALAVLWRRNRCTS